MRLEELKLYIREALVSVYELSEIDAFLYRLITYKLNLSKIDFIMNPAYIINEESELFFKVAIAKLKTEQPIQYILGETEFYGLTFRVTENTLIPRPETEELVDWIIKGQQQINFEQLSILDVGTGSGCIPISLAKNLPNAKVTTVDVSQEAIEVARNNAKENSADVKFVHDSILAPRIIDAAENKYDVIVSNPPYVRNLEKQEIKKNVLAYEPHLALFVADDDALIFYKKIIEYAKEHLNENGVLYFEINQYLGKETVELIKSLGFKSVELRKDMSGNDRMIKASF